MRPALFPHFAQDRRHLMQSHRDKGAGAWNEAPDEQATRSVSLCTELRQLKPGRATARAYEKLMERILEYLFGEYLLDPQPQRRQEDSLSILDITYRIRPSHSFWDTLTRDFRARVIVFEFKNYKNPIRSMQIYSTERYIHVGALRPVCFLISRKSPHKHAMNAALGAMRESGKLLVLLSDDDICKMLDLRDAQLRISASNEEYFQNDPTIVLDQRIYQVLSTMPR
jgi:hypothetical protein